MSNSANNRDAIKKKRKAPPGAWKKGQSGNPAGRAKDGESWSAIISSVGNMYSDDLLSFIGKDNELGREINKYPKNVQVKYLVIVRVISSLMFDPTSGMFKELLDRLEGKVTEHVDMTTKGEALSNLSDEEKILRIFELIQKAGNVKP